MRDRQAVIAENFDGDGELYEDYLNACRAQFARDAAAGDAACQRADHRSLQRLAHSLKGVLALLGDEDGAADAATLETTAAALMNPGDVWPRLRARLLAHVPAA